MRRSLIDMRRAMADAAVSLPLDVERIPLDGATPGEVGVEREQLVSAEDDHYAGGDSADHVGECKQILPRTLSLLDAIAVVVGIQM